MKFLRQSATLKKILLAKFKLYFLLLILFIAITLLLLFTSLDFWIVLIDITIILLEFIIKVFSKITYKFLNKKDVEILFPSGVELDDELIITRYIKKRLTTAAGIITILHVIVIIVKYYCGV